jgi:phage gpG-like protein
MINVAAEFEDKEVRAFLKNMDKRLKDIKGGKKEYMAVIGSAVFTDIITHFNEESNPTGKWKQRKKETKRSQGKHLLIDTDHLHQSFKVEKMRSVSDGIMWFNDAMTKNDFPYAMAHDEGLGKLPQRSFMWFSSQALDKVSELTLAFMLDKGI